MATQFKHNYREFGDEAVQKRVKDMLHFRDEVDVENAHVKFSYDNRKTGALVPSVSLIPCADCPNCKACMHGCYDVRNVCFQKTVQKARANNSALFKQDPEKYFAEILERCRALRFFRWHIGGDIKSHIYFRNMVRIAEKTPFCHHLAFTKNFVVVNDWIDNVGPLPENMHVIFSDWKDIDWFDNPHNLPVSSPLWADGSRGPHCTDDAIMCEGDCSACAAVCGGCWGAKKGQTILFEAH